MKRPNTHVYAIVRVNEFQPPTSAWDVRVTVKEVVATRDDAQREVERLNAVKRGKRCFYFWQLTRMILGGGKNATPQQPS
jgi:hypothetical protein